MKILIAEDTADLNRAITAVLKHEGYDVTSALDGQEAMDYIESDSFDCMVLDIMMPKKSGLEVLTELRSRHILTPVLLLTAKVEIDDRVAGLDAGADDYLTKPFAMKELLARLRALIRRREGYSEDTLSFADFILNAKESELTAGNTVRLSIKEFELMQFLIRNSDKELATEYLLESVWRNEPDAHADTVWLYISDLRGKLSSVGSCAVINGEKGGAYKLAEG